MRDWPTRPRLAAGRPRCPWSTGNGGPVHFFSGNYFFFLVTTYTTVLATVPIKLFFPGTWNDFSGNFFLVTTFFLATDLRKAIFLVTVVTV